MSHALTILADGDELPIKLIFYGFIGVIWLLSAIASKFKKSADAPAEPRLPLAPRAENPGSPLGNAPTPPTMASLLAAMRADNPRMRELGVRPNQPVRRPRPAQTRRPAVIDRSQPAIVQQSQSLVQMMTPPLAAPPATPVKKPARAIAPAKAAAALSKASPSSRASAGLDQPLTARSGHRSVALGDLRGMLQPGFLARQFVVSEILRPPLALRDPNERTI